MFFDIQYFPLPTPNLPLHTKIRESAVLRKIRLQRLYLPKHANANKFPSLTGSGESGIGVQGRCLASGFQKLPWGEGIRGGLRKAERKSLGEQSYGNFLKFFIGPNMTAAKH